MAEIKPKDKPPAAYMGLLSLFSILILLGIVSYQLTQLVDKVSRFLEQKLGLPYSTCCLILNGVAFYGLICGVEANSDHSPKQLSRSTFEEALPFKCQGKNGDVSIDATATDFDDVTLTRGMHKDLLPFSETHFLCKE